MMARAGGFTIAPDHPSLPGHFPGNPVVPGVVLLDHAAACVLDAYPGHVLSGLPSVKFTRPVRPGQAVQVSCAAPVQGRLGFACAVDGNEVARGTLTLALAPP